MLATDLFVALVLIVITFVLCRKNNTVFVSLSVALLCIIAASTAYKKPNVEFEHFEQDPKLDTLPPDVHDRATVYLSSLGANSYSDTSLVWTNVISENTNKNFTFAQQPTFDYLRNGLHIKNITCTGPESVDLGIRGMDDYTILWYGAVQNVIPEKSALEFFTMYANTWSNIGIQIGFANNAIVVRTPSGQSGVGDMVENVVPVDSLSGQNMFAVTKNSGKITVYQGSQQKGSFDVENQNILFSNKPARINGGGTLDMRLCVFALFKKAAQPEELGAILSHIEKRRVEMHDTYIEMWKNAESLQKKAKCPIQDDGICKNACSLVSDWGDTVTVMKNASPECKTQISGYCANNSGTDPFCECWAPSNDGKSECGFVKSFFSNDLTPKQSCPTMSCDTNISQAKGTGSGVHNLSKYYSGVVFNSGGTQNNEPSPLNIAKVDNVFGVGTQ